MTLSPTVALFMAFKLGLAVGVFIGVTRSAVFVAFLERVSFASRPPPPQDETDGVVDFFWKCPECGTFTVEDENTCACGFAPFEST